MSPSKKKAAKTTGKKSAAKAKSPKTSKTSARKKAPPAKKSPKKATKKASPKTPAKKAVTTPAKKAPAKKTTQEASNKPAPFKKATATKLEAAQAASKSEESAAAKTQAKTQAKAQGKAAKGKESRAAKRARAKKPVAPTGPRHPKLGFKWICFGCSAKFYDLGKEDPICPKCGEDQRERPFEDAKPVVESAKPKVVRPMAQLLDDEEPASGADDDVEPEVDASAAIEMFDEAEGDAAGLDIDDVDLTDDSLKPPELDGM